MPVVQMPAVVNVVDSIATKLETQEITIRFAAVPAATRIAVVEAPQPAVVSRPRATGASGRRGWSIVDYKAWHARLAAAQS